MTFNYYVSSEDTDTTDSLIPKFIEKTVVEGRNIPFEDRTRPNVFYAT